MHHNWFVLCTADGKVVSEGLKKRLFGYLLVSQCLNERLIKNCVSFYFRNLSILVSVRKVGYNSHLLQLKSYMDDTHTIKRLWQRQINSHMHLNFVCRVIVWIEVELWENKTKTGAFKIASIFNVVLKVNESRYKHCVVTPHFSTRQNLLKKLLRKDKYWDIQSKYWHNQLRKAFWQICWPQIMQYTVTG